MERLLNVMTVFSIVLILFVLRSVRRAQSAENDLPAR